MSAVARFVRGIVDRVERRWEMRGQAAYDAVRDRDPDIRGLRLMRRRAERNEQHLRRAGTPIDVVRRLEPGEGRRDDA